MLRNRLPNKLRNSHDKRLLRNSWERVGGIRSFVIPLGGRFYIRWEYSMDR